MERKISWASGVFDEIDLVYERAEKNPQIAAILSELEERALQEGLDNCETFLKDNEPLTKEIYSNLAWYDREMLLYRLAQRGLDRFEPSAEEPIITVTFSARIQQVLGCTMFFLLNRLEKLDGTYNVLHFPKATLHLQVPLGGKKGLMKYEMLIMQLYPWLSVRETSTNEMAELPEEKAAPAAPQSKRVEDLFLKEMLQKPSFIRAFATADAEIAVGIETGVLELSNDTEGTLTAGTWRAFSFGRKFEQILAIGQHGITPSTLVCIDYVEIFPYCLAIALLFYAYSGKIEKQLLDTGEGSDISRFKQAIEELRPCWPQWNCKILTDHTPAAPAPQAEPKKHSPMRSKMSSFLRKIADSLSKG
ncbi:MAG: hypothetical protein Q4F17_08110 [Eubacteriales bacterium]|nr:hypothetical protein [Eubacteriales bacterium]